MANDGRDPIDAASHPSSLERSIPVGRRVVLAMVGLSAIGVVIGSSLQRAVGSALGSGLGGLLPGGNRFRIYTITGSYPAIADDRYRLEVKGLVDRPQTYRLADLRAMAPTEIVADFQCVTGWRVPKVHWKGVRLADLLDAAGVKSGAVALAFDSYDGADTESLTLEQARRHDVIVAYEMLGAPLTTPHGGPVRLYVAPMYGYKSIKWLAAIRVVDRVEPGFWEHNGYAVDAWVGASNGRNDAPIG